ncbi:MAG: hypothetical protein RMK99_01120 [Anaerolineales bacterium]|nr:hypothetical protein [Anaerolineales bacterium]
MPFLTWELWLARPPVNEKTLPWQKPIRRLSPGRVRQSLGAILASPGTPAQLPQPRGQSPGWPVGRPRQRAERFPIVKKRCSCRWPARFSVLVRVRLTLGRTEGSLVSLNSSYADETKKPKPS